jgi:hypothetical protein
MKGSRALKEIHEIMEQIYEEEKDLNASQKVERIRKESEDFILKRKLNLKRAKPKEFAGSPK